MEAFNDITREMREGPVHACFVTEVGAASDANRKFCDFADRLDAAYKREVDELRERLKVAEDICNREIACRQKTAARCEMCIEDSSAGEDCPYHGEPNGCNSPTYGEYPSEKECEPFVAIIAAIRGEGGHDGK